VQFPLNNSVINPLKMAVAHLNCYSLRIPVVYTIYTISRDSIKEDGPAWLVSVLYRLPTTMFYTDVTKWYNLTGAIHSQR
jgi:hypothetical protein